MACPKRLFETERRRNKWGLTPSVYEITSRYVLQLISMPQHMGDFIFPWPLGHFETCTDFPSLRSMLALTSGASHFPQVALTLIPHFEHS